MASCFCRRISLENFSSAGDERLERVTLTVYTYSRRFYPKRRTNNACYKGSGGRFKPVECAVEMSGILSSRLRRECLGIGRMVI